MSWTPEREELLKKMWLCGEYSAQQIADKLGNVTRNAVIGKANRLKLSKLVENTPPAIKPKAPNKPVNIDAAPKVARAEKIASPTSRKLKVKLPTPSAKAKPTEAPEPLNLKLLDLTDSTCKWPVNAELEKDYCFCGVTTNATSPYCEYHAQKAFHSLRGKSRKSA